jgi:hypothetical protein
VLLLWHSNGSTCGRAHMCTLTHWGTGVLPVPPVRDSPGWASGPGEGRELCLHGNSRVPAEEMGSMPRPRESWTLCQPVWTLLPPGLGSSLTLSLHISELGFEQIFRSFRARRRYGHLAYSSLSFTICKTMGKGVLSSLVLEEAHQPSSLPSPSTLCCLCRCVCDPGLEALSAWGSLGGPQHAWGWWGR